MSIHVAVTTATVRCYDGGRSFESRDKYSGMVNLIIILETAYAYGALGKVPVKDQHDIERWCREQGCEVLLYEHNGKMRRRELSKYGTKKGQLHPGTQGSG